MQKKESKITFWRNLGQFISTNAARPEVWIFAAVFLGSAVVATCWVNRHPIAWLYSFTPVTGEQQVWVPENATLENPPGVVTRKNIQMGFPLTIEVDSREAFAAIPGKTKTEVIVTEATGMPSYIVDVNHIAFTGAHVYKHWERVWPPDDGDIDGTFKREGQRPVLSSDGRLTWRNSPTEGLEFPAFLCRAVVWALSAALAWLFVRVFQDMRGRRDVQPQATT
jgi:hypothetical protein